MKSNHTKYRADNSVRNRRVRKASERKDRLDKRDRWRFAKRKIAAEIAADIDLDGGDQ